MIRIALVTGLLALCAAQDTIRFNMPHYYDGWNHAAGLKSSFSDRIQEVLVDAQGHMHTMGLRKPMMSLLETGSQSQGGMESMSQSAAHKLLSYLRPVQKKIQALESEAAAARGNYGWSIGGHGMPHSGEGEGRAIWEAFVKSETKEEPKTISPFSFLESSSATQVESVSAATMEARMAAGAKKMRSEMGRRMLEFAEHYQAAVESEAQEAERKVHDMMDKLMTMSLKERKPLMKEYEKLKRDATIAQQAHQSIDTEQDDIYKMMAKYPDEELMNPKEVSADDKLDVEMEKILHDPKMQSMMQMSQEITASSMLQASAEATQMTSMAVTAQGRVAKIGVDEEGTEEQGAAQAAELLKMFDVHVGFHGSAPQTITSFLQTNEKLSDQERHEAQSKALLQRRISKAMSRSAQIDRLLDDAIMDYLSDPKEVEDKPNMLEEIAGAFRSNNDPLFAFSDHPFVERYRKEQKTDTVMPSKSVQKTVLEELLKEAPANMKLAVIHCDLSDPGTRELKIRQDLICLKKTIMKMKQADLDAGGKPEELRVYVNVEGASKDRTNDKMVKEIQRSLEDVEKVHALNKVGNQEVQDYVTGLADFVFRIGEGQLADSNNLDMAAFKTEALRRGGIIRADVTKPPAEMCTWNNQNLDESATSTFEKLMRINKMVKNVEQQKKETKMLSATEAWAQQQRKVEHNHKHHGKAQVDVEFKFKGFANFLQKGGRSASFVQRSRSDAHDSDPHESPNKRHGFNAGMYMPRSRMV